MECKHKLIGDAAGVHCLLCGKRWTPDEYTAMCAKDEQKPEPKPRKKGKTDE